MNFVTLGSLALWHHHPNTTVKARVLLIHGIGEHSARHQHTIDFLLSKGIEVVRFDLRGSGKSGGRRQWIESFDDYVEDAAAALLWIQRELPSLPLYVLGHSLGGAIAIHFAATYHRTLEGLILSSPAYKVGAAVSPLSIFIGKKLARVLPTLRFPSIESVGSLSRDREVEIAYRNDPLCCHFSTLQQGTAILKALDQILQKASLIQCPVLMVHGTHDPVIQPAGSAQILLKLGAADRVLHYLPLTRHEPHNDIDKDHYFGLLWQWLEKQLATN